MNCLENRRIWGLDSSMCSRVIVFLMGQPQQIQAEWSKNNHPVLSTSETKETVTNFRRTKEVDQLPLYINREAVESVNVLW
ncbi:hypothetical protein P4O66_007214, partial [Electrophorus voltai]